MLTGAAPAFGRPLTPHYGSGLLPLRLLWLLQRGVTRFFMPPQSRSWRTLPGPFASRGRISLAHPARLGRIFWLGWPAGKHNSVLVCAVATSTLWVTASAPGSQPPVRLTWLGAVSNHALPHSS